MNQKAQLFSEKGRNTWAFRNTMSNQWQSEVLNRYQQRYGRSYSPWNNVGASWINNWRANWSGGFSFSGILASLKNGFA